MPLAGQLFCTCAPSLLRSNAAIALQGAQGLHDSRRLVDLHFCLKLQVGSWHGGSMRLWCMSVVRWLSSSSCSLV